MSKRWFPKLLALLALLGLTVAHRKARAEFPTLERAIELARARSLVVADAEGALGVANAQLTGARASSLYNPYSEIQIDRGVDPVTPVQALSYTYFPFDIAGQRGKRIDEAQSLIAWRKLGLVDARAIATGDVAVAYGDMLVGSQRIVEAKSGETTARDEAKYFTGRFEARDTTLYEKSLADAEVARWVQSRAEAELRFTAARARFGQLTGTSEPEKPPPGTPVAPPSLRSAWDDARIASIVDRSPVLARLRAEKVYWEASTARYERERIPPLSFEIIAGRGGVGETRLGGGAVITLPITRRYQGEIARAEHGRTHAVRHVVIYRSIVHARIVAARDALASIRNAVDELDKSGLPALERAVDASLEAFRAGKIDLTRAMLARRDLAIARSRRLDLVEAAWRAYADLVIMSGELP